ncbi:hypothetical protein [Planktothrix sp.]|uniref:hypothetical protein n=1 Tax=Planktothrix sp. TaxID=3088171 RepID=UPI0038D36A15
MTLIKNHFDLLYFTNCNFYIPLILDSKIVIPTRQLGLLPSHPLNPKNEINFLPASYLIFDGVKSSVRQLTGYVEETPGSHHFKPLQENPRIVINDDFLDVSKTVSLFGLEGAFDDPLEWVDWEIESASFYLMEHPSYDWIVRESWIDTTNFPRKVMLLFQYKQGINCVYDRSQNDQLVFLSFDEQETKLWLKKQYKHEETFMNPAAVFCDREIGA